MAELTPAERVALERLAFEHGELPDSYLAVESYRSCFLSADLTAAASVVRDGRYVHVSGGILSKPDAKPEFIRLLQEFATRSRSLAACHAVCDQERTLFEAAGWEVTKFGEETCLDLKTLDWSGKFCEWVRRQANYCR